MGQTLMLQHHQHRSTFQQTLNRFTTTDNDVYRIFRMFREDMAAMPPKQDIYLRENNLVIGGLELNFQRTLRVQMPNKELNSLPAGLGNFPLYAVSDYKSGTPEAWKDGTFFLPMHNHEALWINSAKRLYFRIPFAVKIGTGNINSITSKTLEERLRRGKEQDYIVIPPQPWIDGWKAPDGKVYQFVAAELGSGETVEGQITRKEGTGEVQILTYIPKEEVRKKMGLIMMDLRQYGHTKSGTWGPLRPWSLLPMFGPPPSRPYSLAESSELLKSLTTRLISESIELSESGDLLQKIYKDPYGFDIWIDEPYAKTTMYLVNSEDFKQITGKNAPVSPITIEVNE